MCCLLDKTQTIVIFQDDLGKTGTRMLNHSGFPAPRDDGGGGGPTSQITTTSIPVPTLHILPVRCPS